MVESVVLSFSKHIKHHFAVKFMNTGLWFFSAVSICCLEYGCQAISVVGCLMSNCPYITQPSHKQVRPIGMARKCFKRSIQKPVLGRNLEKSLGFNSISVYGSAYPNARLKKIIKYLVADDIRA